MERTHRRIYFNNRAKHQRRSLLIFLTVLMLTFGALASFAVADDGIDSVTITVTSGDTLWDLCSPYKPSNMDIRDFIAKVRYENKLPNSELFVGQELVISLK